MAIFALSVARPASAERIRDVARLKNEAPNEIVGMGLVTGLKGTGDGGDFLPTMRPLKEMMKRFDDPVALEKDLKNANDVAIVMLSCKIPEHGGHAGELLDVKVSALAAKSLKGGRLFVVPMFSPMLGPHGEKVWLGSASGALTLDDDSHPTGATIRGGGVLVEDILAENIENNQFTLVLNPNIASHEKASAIADQINEEVAPQTKGKAVAVAVDASSVVVRIPPEEQANPTPFIGWVMGRPLPNLPEPAIVRIDIAKKTMIFTEEVELAPTMISHGNLTITVAAAPNGGQPVDPPGTREPFVRLETSQTKNTRLRDLERAFDLLKVPADDRIQIVLQLYKTGVLKAKLVIE